MADRCVCCGEIIPEGRQVCPNCEKKAKERDAMDFCGELCLFAEDIINRAKPKWIPVTERLPEAGDTVLVYGSRGGVYTAYMCRPHYWHKLNSKSHYCKPTHWMPLPEPPKGE